MEEKSVRPFVSIIRSKPKLLALLIILLPVLSVTIDNTILSFSLPQITYALSPSAAQQLWIIDAYALVLASLLVTMGGFGDRKGHKNVLFIGSLGFSIVSFFNHFFAKCRPYYCWKSSSRLFWRNDFTSHISFNTFNFSR
ncbi:hypothetical protein ACT7DM_29020 [Bacillus cereus]